MQIDGRLNAVQNVALLEDILHPFVHHHFPGRLEHFIQDNSSVHLARLVTQWFQNHQEINSFR
jgi:hypothetical protein